MGRAAMFLLGIVLDVKEKNNLPKVVMTFPCRAELLFTLFSSRSSHSHFSTEERVKGNQRNLEKFRKPDSGHKIGYMPPV